MKVRNKMIPQIITIISLVLIGIGGYLAFYVRIYKPDREIDKFEVNKDITRIKSEVKNFIKNWQDNVTRIPNDGSDISREKIIEIDNKYRDEYNTKFKSDLKKIKHDAELYLKIYRKSNTSYAEYDRIYGYYDMRKIYDDIEYLEIQLNLRN